MGDCKSLCQHLSIDEQNILSYYSSVSVKVMHVEINISPEAIVRVLLYIYEL